MARDPGSTWAPLPENGGPEYPKTQLIVHSTGTRASAAANRRYFAREDVPVESHFIIGRAPVDPTLQVIDTRHKADASRTASRRAISIEVVGTGDDPFTEWQVAELIRIGRWARRVHGIPARVCPEHDEAGLGWHVMFGAPGPWTSVVGKVCPGGRRIDQLREVIFPAIFTDPTDKSEEDPMAGITREDIRHDVRAVFRDQLQDGGEAHGAISAEVLRQANRAARATHAPVAAELAALKVAITSTVPNGEALVAAAHEGARRALAELPDLDQEPTA